MLTAPEIDNPEALSKYYKLLLAVTRVVTMVVLSRGSQNDQTIESARAFLVDNRPLVVAIFKRDAKIGGVSFDDAGVSIEDLVELFVLLIAATDFLDVSHRHHFSDPSSANRLAQYEEQRDTLKSRELGFT